MEASEKLQIDDIVTLLRTWRANETYGSITVQLQQGRISSIKPQPIIQTAKDFRRHLPEVKQTP